MPVTPIQHRYVECDCHGDEHVLRFAFDPDEGELYTSTFLCHYQRWYKRVWPAIKHIFGYKSRYGHFDNTVISGDNLYELRDIVDHAIDVIEKKKAA